MELEQIDAPVDIIDNNEDDEDVVALSPTTPALLKKGFFDYLYVRDHKKGNMDGNAFSPNNGNLEKVQTQEKAVENITFSMDVDIGTNGQDHLHSSGTDEDWMAHDYDDDEDDSNQLTAQIAREAYQNWLDECSIVQSSSDGHLSESDGVVQVTDETEVLQGSLSAKIPTKIDASISNGDESKIQASKNLKGVGAGVFAGIDRDEKVEIMRIGSLKKSKTIHSLRKIFQKSKPRGQDSLYVEASPQSINDVETDCGPISFNMNDNPDEKASEPKINVQDSPLSGFKSPNINTTQTKVQALVASVVVVRDGKGKIINIMVYPLVDV